MQHGSTKTYVILLLVPLFWGGAFGATKHVLTELPPLTTSAVRFLLAGGIMALWAYGRQEWNWQLVRQYWAGLLGLGISGVFFYNFFFATGMLYTSAINGALVIVVNPVFTACAAVLLFGESWNWRIALGLALSLTGVFFVVTQGNLSLLASQPVGIGELYLFGAVASWVIYTLIGKKIIRQVGASLATAASTLMGAILLTAAAALTENQWGKALSLSAQSNWEMFYLAVFPTFVAFILYNWGIERVGATKTSAYINLMPVNALWIAAVFYGETITLPHIIGMTLTLLGVIITTQTKTPSVAKQA